MDDVLLPWQQIDFFSSFIRQPAVNALAPVKFTMRPSRKRLAGALSIYRARTSSKRLIRDTINQHSLFHSLHCCSLNTVSHTDCSLFRSISLCITVDLWFVGSECAPLTCMELFSKCSSYSCVLNCDFLSRSSDFYLIMNESQWAWASVNHSFT